MAGTKQKIAMERNRFTEFAYAMMLVILSGALCIWYSRRFTDIVEYIKLLIVAVPLVWIEFLLSRLWHRNYLSLLSIVLAPILLFDSFSMWRYEPVIKWGSLTGLVLSALAAILFTWRRMKHLPQGIWECRIFVEAAATTVRILWCAVLLAAVVYGKYYETNGVRLVRNVAYNISGTEGNIEDAENSMEQNMEVLSRLDPDSGWVSLTLEEKADVFEAIVKVECRNLGMRDSAPVLTIGYLPDGVSGQYSYATDNVTLSYKYIADQKDNGYAVLQTLCEELFYRYQAYMAYIPGFDHDINSLAGAVRYEPTYDRLSRELAEEKYGNERVKEYRSKIQDYITNI